MSRADRAFTRVDWAFLVFLLGCVAAMFYIGFAG